MDYIDEMPIEKQKKNKPDMIGEVLRSQILNYAKDFKTSWVNLGQSLYAVWQDKLYYGWGYDKFEDYTEKELGLKKSIALKLLKTYLFVEHEEPAYLKKEFVESREPVKVPGCDEVNVLRMAKQKKELLPEDYQRLRKSIFEKGASAAAVRKDLTAIMKERKPVNPDEERNKRNEAAIRKLLTSLKSFQKDMETLKLLPTEIVEDAQKLLDRLESHL